MTTDLPQVFKSTGAEDEILKNIVCPVCVLNSLVVCDFCLLNTITSNAKVDVSKMADS